MSHQAHNREPRTTLPAKQFRRACADWLDDNEMRQLAITTRTTRRYLVERVAEFFEGEGAIEIGALEMRRFFAHLSATPGASHGHGTDKIKPASVKTYMDHLRPMWKFAVSEGYLDVSPMERIAPPIVRQGAVQPFTDEQIDRLVEASRNTANPARDEAIVKFLIDTGVREAELCAIRLRDIDRASYSVRIVSGKGGKDRTVHYGKNTSRLIWRYLRDGRPELAGCTPDEISTVDEPLFLSDRGSTSHQALTPSGIYQLFTRLREATGITQVRVSPHTCRHTFGVKMYRHGASLFALQMLMGHTRIEQTRKYAAVADADVAREHRQASPVDGMRKGRGRSSKN